MSELVTTAMGDTVAYDLRGSGPAVVFVAGAGPHRAVAPHAVAPIYVRRPDVELTRDRRARGA